VLVGRALFRDVARGRISGDQHGLLELVADAAGERILGVGIVGEGASELVALGQMAMLLDGRVSDFVDNIFNFPTMAEAYRLAALDIASAAQNRRRAA
jgi:NAD(P) transhydrogenase